MELRILLFPDVAADQVKNIFAASLAFLSL